MNYEELEELLKPIDVPKQTLNRPIREVNPPREVRCYICNSIMTEKHYYPNSSTIPALYYACSCFGKFKYL